MQVGIPYWRLSGFYFCYFATLGAFLPFWSLYLEASGFDAVAIGELSAMLAATKIIAPNIWGWIADYIGKSLVVIRIVAFLAACLFAGFLFKTGYLWFAILTISFSFFWNAALPQFEVATLFHLKSDAHRYSRIRLWGSVGFIVTVLLIGSVVDSYGISILPVIIIALLFSIWLLAMMTPEVRAQHHPSEPVKLWKILIKPEVLAFFLAYMLLQVSHGPYYVFFSIYLDDNGYSGTLTGLLWALGVGAEIILFTRMRGLLKRFQLRHMLLWSMIFGVVRWLLIAQYVDQLWILVIAQIMHAATFGLTHVAAIHLVHDYFGARHQGKGQALYSSRSFGLGGMIGSFYSGYFWQAQGSEFVYTLAALCCGLAGLIVFLWVGRENTQKNNVIGLK
jgi:PPP family 3-phenylpropionic acid transporter